MAKSVWIIVVFVFILLLLNACDDAKEQGETPTETAVSPSSPATITNTPTAITSPSPAPITYPPLTIPKELTYCMVSEPDNIFIHDGGSYDEESMWHAIYENLYTTLDYGYQPQGLEKLPNLDDGDAVINMVTVNEGDTVVDAAGDLTELTPGTVLKDANGEAFTFTGTPVMLPQMVVTFTLKPMVWSDGTAVSAQDSVYSYELDKAYDDERRIQRTAGYSAVDDLTVQWIGHPGWLDSTYFLNVWTPLPQHQLATKEGDDPAAWFERNEPVLSSGPFMIDTWISGDSIRFKTNPYYYRQAEHLPYLEIVEVKFIPDTNSILAQLLSGSCDMISQETVSMDEYPFLKEAAAHELLTPYYQTNLIFEHIDFGINSYGEYGDGNGRPDWFEDVRVRQAIAHCTDRQRIADDIYYELSDVMHTYIPPSHPLHPSDLPQYAYDPALGNALLDEAGYLDSNGDGIREDPLTGAPFTVTLETVKINWRREVITQIFQENMQTCGIDVTLSYLLGIDLFADGPDSPLFGRQFDLVEFDSLTGAESPCIRWLSKNITGPEVKGWSGWDNSNNTGWHNDLFDAACAQTEHAFFNSPEHVASHQEAMSLFAEELPSLPLFPRVFVIATRPNVRNVKLNPTQPSEFWNIFELDLERPFAQGNLADVEPARFCADVTEIPTTECEALVILIKHIESWRLDKYYNWLNSPTPCSWVYISCADNHVTELNLSYIGNKHLPSEIGNLTHLNHLDLSYNALNSLPPEIGNLTKLTDLDLSYNNLTNLPSEIGNLTNLGHLDLSNNGLNSLPTSLGNLTNLSHLDLSNNGLNSLPTSLGNLTNLSHLNLSYNSLDNLPSEIGALKALVELDLSYNDLSSLPIEFWELSKLENLDLRGTNFCTLPSDIGNLSSLTSLDLAGVELCDLPIEISNLSNLTFLDLSHNQLTDLPSEIGSLTNLRDLYLSYNQLKSLPSEIGDLANLRLISLSANKLNDLPPEIGNLTTLTHLWLENNNFNSLPPEIVNLTNLTNLDLEYNHFDSFPSEIVSFINLQSLNLSHNNLQNVPSNIVELRNLEWLYLEENPIDALSPELCVALPDGLRLRPSALCATVEDEG